VGYLSGYGLLHDVNRTALIPWLSAIADEVVVFGRPRTHKPFGKPFPSSLHKVQFVQR
jgi:hypothetical protein